MIISNIGAFVGLILGCIAMVFPRKIEAFVNVNATSLEGESEIKATYGGFFIGISAYPLWTQSAEAFLTIGIGWLVAALVRATTIMMGSYSVKNLGAVFFESLTGLLCIWNLI